MSITIRAAMLADIDAIIDLWRSSNMLSQLNDPRQDLLFALSGGASTVFVAVDEAGLIVGSVMVGHDGHRGNLYYVTVAPPFRLRGIGRRLVEMAERWLDDAGVRKVHLLVLDDNIAVLPFYEKLGYGRAPAALLRKWLMGRS